MAPTIKQVVHHLGPRLNSDIKSRTLKRKRAECHYDEILGLVCQMCGKRVRSLHFVHEHGNEKAVVMRRFAERFLDANNRVRIDDLDVFMDLLFEENLKHLHAFGCAECHRKYDAEGRELKKRGLPILFE